MLPKLHALNQTDATWVWNKVKKYTEFEILDRISSDTQWRSWLTKDTSIRIPIRIHGKSLEMKIRSLCSNIKSEFTPVVRTNTFTTLDTADVHEYNDKIQNASLIFPPVNIKGNMIQDNDEDWFRFNTPVRESNFLFVLSKVPGSMDLIAMDDSLNHIQLNKVSTQLDYLVWKGTFHGGYYYLAITRGIDSTIIDLNTQVSGNKEKNKLDSSFEIESTTVKSQNRFNILDTMIWTIKYTGTSAVKLMKWHVIKNETNEKYAADLIKLGAKELDTTPIPSNTTVKEIENHPIIQPGETFILKLVASSNSIYVIGNEILTPISLNIEHVKLVSDLSYHLKVAYLEDDQNTE
jgi:hypothetical protein